MEKFLNIKVPTTVQGSIPYKRVYERENLIEIKDGYFTRSYLLKDVNFSTAKTEDKEHMFIQFGRFLNQFDNTVEFQITINNKNMDLEEFQESVLMRLQNDHLDDYRIEYNEMITDKMLEGKNNLTQEKYLTVGIEAENAQVAATTLNRIDGDLVSAIRSIAPAASSSAKLLTLQERLEVLHDIYNIDHSGSFSEKMFIDDEVEESFSFKNMQRMGLTTKDLVAPDSLMFERDHFMVGDKYARVLYIKSLPPYLGTSFLTDLTSNNFNQIVSMNYKSLSADKAYKLVSRNLTAINAELVEKQKKAATSGYDASLVSPKANRARDEVEELLQDLSSRNQSLFLMAWTIVVFADSKKELEDRTETIISKGKLSLVEIRKLNYQQEAGFAQVLPLCNNSLHIQRAMTTESASVFMPFDSQELVDEGGIYYGVNSASKNLIVHDRKKAKNQNGFILGVPGAGKSFIAKNEMLSVILNTDDDVIVIDPEGEYEPLANILGGEVVPISIGSQHYLNPFDITLDYAAESLEDNRNPIPLKSDFIVSMMDVIAGSQWSGLSPIQKSVIDRAVRLTYKDYMDYLNSFAPGGVNEGGTPDKTKAPTLVDFRNQLLAQREMEAKELAIALEAYTDGSSDIFSHHSNVEINTRFTVFDIKDVGNNIKTLAMLIVLDAVWSRIIENRKRGKRTWLYIDEIYILFENDSSAEFLTKIWKRARKWGGIPTGITQNVEDLLESDVARTMISNSEFVLMLNQAPLDRRQLAHLLEISETQLSYITNAEQGHGLLYTGGSIVPFVNRFPSDTKLYAAMTTKPEEVNRGGSDE